VLRNDGLQSSHAAQQPDQAVGPCCHERCVRNARANTSRRLSCALAGKQKRMLARIGLIGMLLVILLVPLVLYVCSDRRGNDYASLADVGDAMAHGWLPRWITSDATGIREIHNLDTNETWGVFTFGRSGSDELVVACREVPETSIPFPRSRPGNWWPRELVDSSDNSGEYRLMKCQERSLDKPGQWETSSAFAAIRDKAHVAYFWRVSG